MNLQFEKNKLYAYLGGLTDILAEHKVFIAGGAITSLFNNKEINDIDIYFRNEESALSFISDIWSDQIWIASHTKKATQFTYPVGNKSINIQAIHFKYFNTPEDIFNTFDYTVCMGAFDFEKEEFVLHNDFLKHNSQRILKFNSSTAFPIVSLLRVQKYEKKGYKISKPEFIRIALTCMNLDISSYEELKEQMGGMYGVNYDKLFEDIEEGEEFSLQDAIDKIADLVLDEDYFKEPIQVEFNNLEDILDSISIKPIKYININGDHYRINHDGFLKSINEKPDNYIEIDPQKFFSEIKLYKFVEKKDGRYFSFYNKKFEYELCKEVVASSSDRNDGKLYFNEKGDLHNSTYESRDSKAAIEVIVNPSDFIEANDGVVKVSKCYVIREVPKEEYEQWDQVDHVEEIQNKTLAPLFTFMNN
ncbi:hypothetical protein [Siminovitchia fordii]|uniref:Uncharacterized protein n=1 Tax=Siminovitchia fordii TaxID=254759 RepID=A0ABQ4KA06_9BACI|nr:hypothetical protein [Siminovitchia fordii]GIN22553.1 hypothetical protein J1TS3_36870 [Siminovitchia fordii]